MSWPAPSHHRRPTLGIALAILLVHPVSCAAGPASAPPVAESSPRRRVVLIGLDGADWLAIDPFVEAGKLPTFARLKTSGRTGILIATPPLLSPILWTTIATGRSPEDHGVLDFMVDLPGGGQAPVAASSRRVPALWTLFSQAGRAVAVVGWWATWPAESVRGTIVSDRVAPQLTRPEAALDAAAISPASAAARLTRHIVRSEQVSLEELRRYVPLTAAEYEAARAAARLGPSLFYKDPIAHLGAVAAGTRTYAAMAQGLLAAGPDLLAVYLEGVDTVSHLFIKDGRRGPPALQAAYEDADALIARLASASAPDTLVVVCSDHGFQPPTAAADISEDPADLTGPASAWHRPYGIVAVAEAGAFAGVGHPGPHNEAGATVTVTPLDIAPTVLHAAGLPVPAEMPGRVVRELLPAEVAARAVRRAPAGETARPGATAAPAVPMDDGAMARLRALGYVGAAPTSLAGQNLGEVLYRQGKLAAAERQLRKVVEDQPQNLTAWLWLAKALRDQGRAQEAFRAYEQALRLPGAAGDALVEATELAVAAGLKEDARRIVHGFATRRDEREGVHTARAVLARADGQERMAERELRAALAADPASFDALFRLFDLLHPAGRLGEVLPLVRRGAERAPASPRHRALLGEALLAAGDNAGAERELRRALALAPDSAPVRIDLARAQIAQGRGKEARATLEPTPPSPERSVLLGAVASGEGRWDEAAEHYEAALKAAPPTPELLNGLGWAHHKRGKDALAAELLRRSLVLKSNQPEIRGLLGRIEASRPAPAR